MSSICSIFHQIPKLHFPWIQKSSSLPEQFYQLPKTKFVEREQLAPILDKLKKRGKVIVLAGGCYDLMHIGHVRQLQSAKEAVGKRGVLVVALNTDESVKKNKGPTRPLIPLAERAELISALSCVDYVTSFDELTGYETVEKLVPNYFAKGTDYSIDKILEIELIRKLGGKVIFTGDPKDHSTTDLIAKIQNIAKEKMEAEG